MADFRAKAKEYLCKHQLYPSQISLPPSDRLALVVAIPSREEPHLGRTLRALLACTPPACAVEVLICVNGSAQDAVGRQANADSLAEILCLSAETPAWLSFYALDFSALPEGQDGVGLARKLAMDAGVTRLRRAGALDGVIACLDADCVCDTNYLCALYEHFIRYPLTPACSVYFEHPLDSDDNLLNVAAVRYELYLRYYRSAQALAGHPHAYYTVGSSMAVRASAYVAQGGMNRRRGAEDFYFLVKLFKLGGFTELNSTKVMPAARLSQRVPFGTGRALSLMTSAPDVLYTVYPLAPFDDLATLFAGVSKLRTRSIDALVLSDPLTQFLYEHDAAHRVSELRRHCSTTPAFVKRFFQWFDPFKVLKFVRFANATCYPSQPVAEVAFERLAREGLLITGLISGSYDERTLLERYRVLDRYRSVDMRDSKRVRMNTKRGTTGG